jgi:hypothetical protein
MSAGVNDSKAQLWLHRVNNVCAIAGRREQLGYVRSVCKTHENGAMNVDLPTSPFPRPRGIHRARLALSVWPSAQGSFSRRLVLRFAALWLALVIVSFGIAVYILPYGVEWFAGAAAHRGGWMTWGALGFRSTGGAPTETGNDLMNAEWRLVP